MREPEDKHALELGDLRPSSRRTWAHLALLAGIVVVCGYRGNVLGVLATRLPDYFGIAVDSVGLLFAAPLLASIIPHGIAGPLIDRWGAKATLLVALYGVALAFGLCGVGTQLGIFAAGTLVAGLFNPAVGLSFQVYVARLHPHGRRRMLSLAMMVTALPGVIFPLSVGRLITAFPQHFPYVLHLPFLAGAVLLVVGAMLFRRAPSDAPAGDAPHEGAPTLKEGLRLLRRGPIWVIVLLAVLHGVSDGVFVAWFPIYATRQFGEALRHPGDVLALCAMAYVIARTALALVPEGRGQRALLIAPGLIGGSILLACIWLNEPRVMFWGYPLAAFAWSSEYPALLSEASRRAPRYFGSLLSVMVIAMHLVSAGLMALVGVLIKAMAAAEATAPWWQRDLRLVVTVFPLGFILFGVLAGVSGLGRHPKQRRQSAEEGTDGTLHSS